MLMWGRASEAKKAKYGALEDGSSTPLLGDEPISHERSGRRQTVAAALLIGGFCAAAAWSSSPTKPSSSLSLEEEVPFFVADTYAYTADVIEERWSTNRGGPRTSIEEHVLWNTMYDRPGKMKAAHYGLETYAMWRYAIQGPRSAAADVDVTSTQYRTVREFKRALTENRLSEAAVVFFDVRSTALDVEWDAYEDVLAPTLSEEQGANYDLETEPAAQALLYSCSGAVAVYEREGLSAEYCATHMDFGCVYSHTADPLMRSSALRQLLAYDKPLTIIISGDNACRLDSLPATHHDIIFSNDGSALHAHNQAPNEFGGSFKTWPQGLEGYEADTPREMVHATWELTDVDWVPLKDREYLIAGEYSVNDRKPSRMNMLEYLTTSFDADFGKLKQQQSRKLSLVVTANPTSPMVTLNSSVVKEQGNYIFGDPPSDLDFPTMTRSSVFALCPAGDLWTGGRMLESLLSGAIPVVDMTYVTDKISNKNCDDPAAFWRDGSPDFPQGAPFVFFDEWSKLPQALIDFGALDDVKLQSKIDQLAAYRQKLEVYLASLLVSDKERTKTECVETAFDEEEDLALKAKVAKYYSPMSSTEWYDSFDDSPAIDGARCTKYLSVGATPVGNQCYHADCAPPSVKSFTCSAAGSQ